MLVQSIALNGIAYFPTASNNPSGSAADGTTPTWRVHRASEADSAAPVLTGTANLLSNGGFSDGSYKIQIDTSGIAGLAVTDVLLVYFDTGVGGETPVGAVGMITFDGNLQKVDHVKTLGTTLTESTAGNLATNQSRYWDGNNTLIVAADIHVGVQMTETQNDQIGYRLGLNRTFQTPTVPGTLDLNELHIGAVNDTTIPLRIMTGAASTVPAMAIQPASNGSRAISIDAPVGNTANLIELNHLGSGSLVEYNTASGFAYVYTGVGAATIDDNDHGYSASLLFAALGGTTQQLTGPPSDTASPRDIIKWLQHRFGYETDQDPTTTEVKNATGTTIATSAITEPVAGEVRRGKFV